MISTRHLRPRRSPLLTLQYASRKPTPTRTHLRWPSQALLLPQIRHLSSESPATAPSTTPTTSTSTSRAPKHTQHPLNPGAANPPHTTRPAPLVLPTRTPSTSTPRHLLATGKAYIAFYKSGLKNLLLNQRLARALRNPTPLPEIPSRNPDRPPSIPNIQIPSRAAHQLLARAKHDLHKLPLFGLLLAVCGEFTPLVVLLLPKAVPYTCRIPRQVEKLRRKAEERRAASFAHLRDVRRALEETGASGEKGTILGKDATAHIARSLGLVAGLWDRVGLVPGFLAEGRVRRKEEFLVEDDVLLIQAGGVDALEGEEVVLACEERGIDVLGREEIELRGLLGRWLEGSGGLSVGKEERRARVHWLLLERPDKWPCEG